LWFWLAWPALFFVFRYAPFLVTLSPTSPGRLNLGPLETFAKRREIVDAQRREAEERRREASDPARRPWTCPTCGSDNPSEFDLCWGCDGARPEDESERGPVDP